MSKLIYWTLALFAIVPIFAIRFLWGNIKQPTSYHDFADKRTLIPGIPNTQMVLSNITFIISGVRLFGYVFIVIDSDLLIAHSLLFSSFLFFIKKYRPLRNGLLILATLIYFTFLLFSKFRFVVLIRYGVCLRQKV